MDLAAPRVPRAKPLHAPAGERCARARGRRAEPDDALTSPALAPVGKRITDDTRVTMLAQEQRRRGCRVRDQDHAPELRLRLVDVPAGRARDHGLRRSPRCVAGAARRPPGPNELGRVPLEHRSRSAGGRRRSDASSASASAATRPTASRVPSRVVALARQQLADGGAVSRGGTLERRPDPTMARHVGTWTPRMAPELEVVDLLELLHELRRAHGRMLEREARAGAAIALSAVTDASTARLTAAGQSSKRGTQAPSPLVVPQDRQGDQQARTRRPRGSTTRPPVAGMTLRTRCSL